MKENLAWIPKGEHKQEEMIRKVLLEKALVSLENQRLLLRIKQLECQLANNLQSHA